MHDLKKVPQIEPDMCELASGEKIFIHLFRPEDAPGIGQLFHAVYGDEYPIKHFYNPPELLAALERGENYSIVARTEDGRIIGHMGIFRSSPHPSLYECGAGLVLPEYRKGGVNLKLLEHTYERLIPELKLEEVWGEAVCNHVSMQKAVIRHNHVETGLEVDLMPAEAYAKEKSSSGRVASLVVFRAYVPRPHTVYLPPVYEKVLRFLYSGLDDRRTLAISRERAPADVSSQASTEIFDFPQVARIAVSAIGEDFDSYFHSIENEILIRKMMVFQVWINLACPWAGRAVETLRSRGYFFGGILPRWFDDDALLMQKIVGRPNWEGINLFNDRAKQILEFVRNDWEEEGRLQASVML
jgi:GNAT superfamily N-acetyltransferase